MYIEYNVNPADKKVGDCVIRALTKAPDEQTKKEFRKFISKVQTM